MKVNRKFFTESDCITYLEQIRWNGKPVCPYCNSDNTTLVLKEQRHHCNCCNTTFSVTVGTIFHHTHLPLQKWFLAISLVLNMGSSISTRQLARELQINKNSGWYLVMRIYKAMAEPEQRQLLQILAGVDET